MAKVLVNENNLTNIANAIRGKNGSTDTYKPSEMAAAITAISGGGASNEKAIIERTFSGIYTNNEITKIGDYAFAGLENNITGINAPNVESVGEYAFRGCGNIQSINMPKVKTIGINAFGYSVYTTMPKCVTNNTFPLLESCYNGTEVFGYMFDGELLYLPNIKERLMMVDLKADAPKYINLPEFVDQYTGRRRMFGDNKVIQKVWLPKVADIQYKDFNGCTALVALILAKTTLVPLTNVNAFENSTVATGTGYIYVPSALVSEYKTATNWVTYASQIRAIEDYPDICEAMTP